MLMLGPEKLPVVQLLELKKERYQVFLVSILMNLELEKYLMLMSNSQEFQVSLQNKIKIIERLTCMLSEPGHVLLRHKVNFDVVNLRQLKSDLQKVN